MQCAYFKTVCLDLLYATVSICIGWVGCCCKNTACVITKMIASPYLPFNCLWTGTAIVRAVPGRTLVPQALQDYVDSSMSFPRKVLPASSFSHLPWRP